MTNVRVWTLSGLAVIALVVGVLLASGSMTSAQSTTVTATPAASTATPAATTGTFSSNEDPTHETNETADHEAAEDSGQFRGGHGGASNEDPTHEANESAEREAAEGVATATPGA